MYGQIQYCIKNGHDWKIEQRFFNEEIQRWMIQKKCLICGCRSLAFGEEKE